MNAMVNVLAKRYNIPANSITFGEFSVHIWDDGVEDIMDRVSLIDALDFIDLMTTGSYKIFWKDSCIYERDKQRNGIRRKGI